MLNERDPGVEGSNPFGAIQMRFFRSFPFATTFVVAGFFVGFSILFSTDFFVSYDISKISQNPAGSLINYFRDYSSELWGIVAKGFALGVVLGSILGFGGFIIDFLRREPSVSTNYGVLGKDDNLVKREV